MFQRGQRVKVLGLGGKEGVLVVWEPKAHGAGLCTPDGYAVLKEGREAPIVGFPAKDILGVVEEPS